MLSRRALVRSTWLAAGVAVLATAGSTVPWLRRVSVLGVRSGDGPGASRSTSPPRRPASTATATAAAYRLVVGRRPRGQPDAATTSGAAPARPRPADRLRRGLERERHLERACGSATCCDLVGAPRRSDVAVESLQPAGPYRRTHPAGRLRRDDRTLLALDLDGEPLALDHGYPCRLIAPNRPGVLQTKWVARLEVTS